MLKHSVRIRLDGGNDQVLHPGQVVSGNVEYKAPPGEHVVGVSIDFRGVTKIVPRKGSKLNTEFIEIFHMGENLLGPPGYFYTETGGKYSWDFTFVLPTLTGPDRSAGTYMDAGNPLFEERPHTLPPNMDDGLAPEVRIEYNMHAVAREQISLPSALTQSGSSSARPIVHNLEHLSLRPDIEHLEPESSQIYRKTFENVNAPRRKLSLTSLKQPLGFSPFTLIAEVPKTVVIGEDVQIRLSISHPTTEPTSDTAYTVKLASLGVQSRTHRRTARVEHDSSATSMSLTKVSSQKSAGTVPGTSSIPLCLEFRTDVLAALPPSFKSYSIAREYYMVLDITLEGEGRREFNTLWMIPFELVLRANNAQILARRESTAPPPPPPVDIDDDPLSAGLTYGTYHQRRAVGDDDELPAYAPRNMRPN